MATPTLFLQDLSLTRRGKRERIALMEFGEMRTILYGIDVTDAILAQERVELELIETVLQELGARLSSCDIGQCVDRTRSPTRDGNCFAAAASA
jgi:hypothetical protein